MRTHAVETDFRCLEGAGIGEYGNMRGVIAIRTIVLPKVRRYLISIQVKVTKHLQAS